MDIAGDMNHETGSLEKHEDSYTLSNFTNTNQHQG